MLKLLKEPDPEEAVKKFGKLPRRKVINILHAHICSDDPETRWRAIRAMGALVAELAEKDIEAGRTIMRRFMWNLNDESGSMAWGAPESMAEIMALHEGLAREFSHILISYIVPGGSYLDFQPLQSGAVWGIARLAQQRPGLAAPAAEHLLPLLGSPDPATRALSAKALALIGKKSSLERLEELLKDEAHFETFDGKALVSMKVSQAAREALDLLECKA